jgi:hypothetical protein
MEGQKKIIYLFILSFEDAFLRFFYSHLINFLIIPKNNFFDWLPKPQKNQTIFDMSLVRLFYGHLLNYIIEVLTKWSFY